ncbi:MAG: efflux RND transporter permease subunit [Gammaproteobacteria bacterium]
MPTGRPTAFTDIFIHRPVLASVLALLILALGLQALTRLPLRQFPQLTKTTISILTTYPGADAELMQGFVSTPLQQAVASAEGVDFVSAASARERSQITVDLRLNADANRAVADVLTRINQVRAQLPRDANDPVVTRTTGDIYPLVYLAFSSAVLSSAQLADYIDRAVKPTLQAIAGVGDVQVSGAQTLSMRIWLDPARMAARGVTALDVAAAVRSNHYVSAPGTIKGDFLEVALRAETDLASPGAFADLVVRADGDRFVRLRDVADVEIDERAATGIFYSWDRPGVMIGVFPAPGANPLQISAELHRLMPQIQARFPPGVNGGISRDYADEVRASIREVLRAIAEAAIIVVVVVFLFLGNPRAMVIPVVTIPLSLIGVMLPMYALGYSLNLFTLLAMVLAIGLVVDDAIVVVENIFRHIEEGEAPKQAALRGAREVALPVVAMTLTLVAVFAPIGFLGGMTGILFREFAFTLAGAVLISGLLALTLSPTMAARLLKAEDAADTGGASHLIERALLRLRGRYERRLSGALDHRPAVLIVAAGVFAMALLMAGTARHELAPVEDTSGVTVILKTPANSNLDYARTYAQALFPIYRDVPEAHGVAYTMLTTDPLGFSGLGLRLVPPTERERGLPEILQEVQARMRSIAGFDPLGYVFSNVPGAAGGPPVQFVLRTTADNRVLYETAQAVVQAARDSGRFLFVDSDLRFDLPRVRVAIDHAKANQLGISMADIGQTLATMLGGNYLNRFALAGRSYEVIPQAPRGFRLDPESIGRYYLRAANGAMVPLSTVVDFQREVQPRVLHTFQQLNSATISAVPFPGQTIGESLDWLRGAAAALMPAGFSYDFAGESRQFVQESGALTLTFGFALLVIFLVLAAQFESWRDPLIILAAVPLSIFGALLPVAFGNLTLNIYTQIGLITLIGLISKHGILMVQFANKLQAAEGLDRRQAIVRAAAIRMRPILMTTGAMVMGTLPLVTATGEGAESRFAIGIVIASGVAIGTVFTLFVVPAIYTVIARSHASDASA